MSAPSVNAMVTTSTLPLVPGTVVSSSEFAAANESESTSGEQMDLIDVTPKELKRILPIAKEYRRVVKQRVKLTAKEVTLKGQILEEVKKAKLPRLDDGSVRFKCDGITISVTPRDELVKVKEADEDS